MRRWRDAGRAGWLLGAGDALGLGGRGTSEGRVAEGRARGRANCPACRLRVALLWEGGVDVQYIRWVSGQRGAWWAWLAEELAGVGLPQRHITHVGGAAR